MTEEELANHIALQHIRMLQQENDQNEYHRNGLHASSLNSEDHASVVNNISRRIAKAAFSSEERAPMIPNRFKQTGSSIVNFAKHVAEKPGVKEGFIVASVMLFKMGLWFAYRNASKEGLEIVDL